MKVIVKFSPYISSLTKTKQTVVNIKEGSSLRDLFKVLVNSYGKSVIERIYKPKLGQAEPTETIASIIIDRQVILLKNESDVKLKEGSIITLITPVGGG